ncbi:MAG: response regulator [Planctomycetota bacterium]|nr:response regulator [Planctomycetota bacterium]
MNTAQRKTVHVLVVDDSKTVQLLQRVVLEEAGHSVSLASNGQQALEIVHANPRAFDLVLSDIDMPQLDGFGLLSELRKSHTKEELPVILISSMEKDVVKSKGMELGANECYTKQNFNTTQLLSVVGSYSAHS